MTDGAGEGTYPFAGFFFAQLPRFFTDFETAVAI